MKEKLNKVILGLFTCIFTLISTMIIFQTEVLYASENHDSDFIKKVSKSYTKKCCNAIGFGLSKESAMNFSIEENKQVFKKRKEMNNINKELLADEIALSVVDSCGYQLNISGEKDIQEFSNSYLSKFMILQHFNI